MGFFKKLLGFDSVSQRFFHPKLQWSTYSLLDKLMSLKWVSARALKRGMDQVDRGEFAQAIPNFGYNDFSLDNEVASFERGRAYWHLGRFQEAVGDLLRIAQSNPKDPVWLSHIYYFLGDSYREVGNYDLAILNLGIALRFRADPNAYLSRGWAYQAKNDHVRAMTDFAEAIRLDPVIKTRVAAVSETSLVGEKGNSTATEADQAAENKNAEQSPTADRPRDNR
jgi:tetratricopeptide (TPR) repeat protein